MTPSATAVVINPRISSRLASSDATDRLAGPHRRIRRQQLRPNDVCHPTTHTRSGHLNTEGRSTLTVASASAPKSADFILACKFRRKETNKSGANVAGGTRVRDVTGQRKIEKHKPRKIHSGNAARYRGTYSWRIWNTEYWHARAVRLLGFVVCASCDQALPVAVPVDSLTSQCQTIAAVIDDRTKSASQPASLGITGAAQTFAAQGATCIPSSPI